MNKKKFELQFDAKMELSDIKKQLGVLSASLDKLEIPANMTKNLESAFKKALDQLASFETLSEKGVENLSDISKVEKAWAQVTNSLDNINSILKTIDTSNLFSKDAKKNIESAEKALNEYLQKVEQAKKSSVYQAEEAKRDNAKTAEKAQRKELDRAIAEQVKAENNLQEKKADWNDQAIAQYKAEQEELQNTVKELQEYERELEKLKEKRQELISEGYINKGDLQVSSKARQAAEKGTKSKEKIGQAERIVKDILDAETLVGLAAEKQKSAKAKVKKSEQRKTDFETAVTDLEKANEQVAIHNALLEKAQERTAAFEQALSSIAQNEALPAWTALVQIIKEITGANIEDAAGDIEAIKRAVSNYKQDELEKAPGTVEKLKEEAEEAKGPVKQVAKGLEELGNTGKDLADAADEMDRLKQQVLDFFSVTNAIDIFKRALSDAFQTVKELDAVMTEAAVVTDFSIGDMWGQMPQYSKNASELGVATKDLYSATTLYYQQGLKGNDVMKVGAETMKMAKIASMDAAQATEAMTAALRGFNMEVSEMNAQKVNDVYSKLAAITAADTSQIATAMSKTASIAAGANMEFETTAAFLAQIIETTQEAPETAGTALKTIVARFSEVKELQSQGLMSGVDAEGEAIDINKISTALRSVGISMDAFFAGQEGLDDVLLRLSQKWNTLDFTTQRYIATTAAGSRQQSRFIAMMSNYGRTMELVGAANDSAGASQEQYEKTLDSLDSKLAQLKNAWDQFTMGLANNEALKFGVDFLTGVLETVNKLTDAISGGSGLVKSLTSLMTVIGALKLGGKVLGKNGETGLLGRFGSIFSKSGAKGSSGEYKRGYKDGYNYEKGYQEGREEATKQGSEVQEEIIKQNDKTKESFNQLSAAALGVGTAFGLLSIAFEAAGMKEAAEVTGVLAATFTTLGAIIPVVGKVLTAVGIEVSLAWGWVAGIAIAITAITTAIYFVAKAAKESSLEYKLEKAQEATENAKKAAEEAKAAYDDLLDRKSGYSELQKTLNNLTKGTNEWKAALIESNQQVVELIEKYPELSEMGTIKYEEGRMTITDAGWEKIEQLTLARSQASQAAYIGASISETNLEFQKALKDAAVGAGFSEEEIKELYEISRASDREQKLKQKENSLIARMEANNKTYGYGNGTGTSGGGYGAAQQGNYINAIYQNQQFTKQLTFLQEGLDKFTSEYDQKMAQYIEQLKNYTQALLVYAKDETQESEFYSKVASGIANYRGEDTLTRIETEKGNIIKNIGSDEIREQYIALTGQEPAEGTTMEQMAEALASDKVAKALSGDVDTIVAKLESIKDPSTRRVVAAALSGDISGLTMDELAKLKSMDQQQIGLALGYTPDKTGEFQAKTGLTGQRAYDNKQIYNKTYDRLVEDIGISAFTMNEDFLGGLTYESVAKLASQIDGGKINPSQANSLISALQTVLGTKGLAKDDRLELENAFANTDWADPFSAMNAMDTMLGKGVGQKDIVNYWRAATVGGGYVDSRQEGLQLAARMQGKVGGLSDLSGRLSEGTATLEDLQMLEKAGVDTKNYKLTAEGWKATAEEADEAVGTMQKYYLTQAELQKQEIQAEKELNTTTNERKAELDETLDIVEKTIEMLKQPITTTYSIETNIDLLDRIKQAIVFDRQKEIDKLSEINDTIANTNSRIVTAMRESVDSYRRERENEKTEQSIADKQTRLSYLKMDTSGANDLEIKRLEEEITQEQESYTDRLIDEKISELERQNDIAQEQRAQQIQLLQTQLEVEQSNGSLWTLINTLISEAYNDKTGELDQNSRLVQLMRQAEGYNGLSSLAQEQWTSDLITAFKEGIGVEVKVNVYLDDYELPTVLPVVNTGTGQKPGLPTLGPNSQFVAVQAYASGGLADFTGPAWLDGTKTNPEYVLSAQQTERFFELVDVLSSLKSGSSNATQNNRENNFDIDINVESISSDYDVEQVAIKVKDFIVNSSRYRNNNTL